VNKIAAPPPSHHVSLSRSLRSSHSAFPHGYANRQGSADRS
jgi:hypothetical protein